MFVTLPRNVFLALLAFSDGNYVGAILDRNGLRPARYYLTKDDHLYLSSEVGVIDLPEDSVIEKVCLVMRVLIFILTFVGFSATDLIVVFIIQNQRI